jgi:hypothetical protein
MTKAVCLTFSCIGSDGLGVSLTGWEFTGRRFALQFDGAKSKL